MSDSRPKVSILSPIKLNMYSLSILVPEFTGYKAIFTCGKLNEAKPLLSENKTLSISELLRMYYRLDCKAGEKMYPIAIYPPHLDQRMAAQQTCFTLFGNVATGLETLPIQEKYIETIFINPINKFAIIRELKLLGISEYSVRPDLDGLGQSINQDSFYDLNIVQQENEVSHFFANIEKENS